MKAKSGYSGLESFPLSLSTNRPGLLRLSGHDAKVRLINDLFDAGNEEEARRMLRKALDEVTRDLDRILGDGRQPGTAGDKTGPNGEAALLLAVET